MYLFRKIGIGLTSAMPSKKAFYLSVAALAISTASTADSSFVLNAPNGDLPGANTPFFLQLSELDAIQTSLKPKIQKKKKRRLRRSPELKAEQDRVQYSATEITDEELSALDAELAKYYETGANSVEPNLVSGYAVVKPDGTFAARKPVITPYAAPKSLTTQVYRPKKAKTGGFGRYTIAPTASEIANRDSVASSPVAPRKDQGVKAYPRFTPNNPWGIPVSVNLTGVRDVATAMGRVLEFAGYRLRTTGVGVDSEAVASLSAPVPLSLRRIDAPSLTDALTTLAGPGLIVVIDHANRLVSVDTSIRSAKLASN